MAKLGINSAAGLEANTQKSMNNISHSALRVSKRRKFNVGMKLRHTGTTANLSVSKSLLSELS